MPALFFTADSEDVPFDRIGIPGHGLTTGAGPILTSTLNFATSGGGNAALPGGLADGTDYYWITIDADFGRLALSRENAVAGVAIDITSGGAGWLLIGLPFRRHTYANGSQVDSRNLNEMQNCIVEGRHGLETFVRTFSRVESNTSVSGSAPVAQSIPFPIPMDGLRVGDMLIAGDVIVSSSAGTTGRLSGREFVRLPTPSDNLLGSSVTFTFNGTRRIRINLFDLDLQKRVSESAGYVLDLLVQVGGPVTVHSARWSVLRL